MRREIGGLLFLALAAFGAGAVDVSGVYPCINDCVDAGGNQEECARDCIVNLVTSIDTDGDGIPDVFEFFMGTNPFRADSMEDPDGDGLVNLEEYFQRSNPFDPFDPIPTFFVSPDGFNDPLHGTRESPWRDIGYAVSVLEPNADLPVNIVLRTGIYQEDLVLKPGVLLRSALFNHAIINGTIVGAENAALHNITVVARRLNDVLLTVDDVRMRVSNVSFRGGFFRSGMGMWLGGGAAFDTLVEGCSFENLELGMDVTGAIPLIRKSRFDNLKQAAVVLRSSSESFPSHTLGSSEDPGSGWNFFSSAVEGVAVVNERSDTVPMENNDWDTDDPGSSDNRVDGPADIEPFLVTGSAVLAGAVYCSVWEAGSQQAVTDAVVSLTPSGYNPITQNESGVYVFSAVPEGTYTASAVHPTLGTTAVGVQVPTGGVLTVNLPLGDAPIPSANGCNCGNPGDKAPMPAGDAVIAALFLGVLSVKRRQP